MKHTKRKSIVKDKQYKKDYSGESSPYDDYMKSIVCIKNGHHGVKEYSEQKEANPDVLSEMDSLYAHEVYLDPEQVEMVEKTWPLLTSKQQQALTLVGLEGKTFENAAAIMGVARSNVFQLVDRARKIIKKNGNIR